MAGQNVAEIASWHGEVDGIAKGNGFMVQQLLVGGEVVDDLGQEAANIHGVGAGEGQIVVSQQTVHVRVVKNLLDPGLGLVKVALNRYSHGVVAVFAQHLLKLDRGHPLVRVKDDDPGFG